MKAGTTKQAQLMLNSIEKIGQDMTMRDGAGHTKEITQKLKESKKKFSEILSTSYDGAFNVLK